ncbi:hypothetical protein RKE25_23205 (plasmid) [Dyella sp. BiH032]|uniref:hypothetical protein n=1 Tax=Dyella sp. BiH032 TaxID=3075430 RepID=UPI0028931F95|nr:hypothetical protein [Dyella sp. BiH032]WNL48524.1 hypothetical protein RKE25_23205 [Dyella sp. BiH032]
MVLETAWFVVLAVAGLALCAISGVREARGEEGYKPMVIGIAAGMLSFVPGWSFTISPLWDALNRWIPEHGSDLHWITVFVLCGLVWLGGFVVALAGASTAAELLTRRRASRPMSGRPAKV